MGFRSALQKNKGILLYGTSLAVLLFFMRRLEYRYLIISNAQEIYTGFIALIFTGLGIWLALKLARPKKATNHQLTLQTLLPVTLASEKPKYCTIWGKA